MRVPPDQSSAAPAARSSARSGSRPRELGRDAGEPRSEHERLDPPARGHAGLHVLEQHAGVGLHRAGHVADEHERARALGGLAPVALERVAARAQRGADRPAQVRAGRVRRRAAPRGAARAPARAGGASAGDPPDQPARQLPLGVRVVGEVLVAQELRVGPGGGHAHPPRRPPARRTSRPGTATRGSTSDATSSSNSGGSGGGSEPAPRTARRRPRRMPTRSSRREHSVARRAK